MSTPPLSLSRPTTSSKSIPSLPASSLSPSSSASFGTPKSSFSARKKPKGLDISESLKSTRRAPLAPGETETKDGLSEAEKLRREIDRLQLSSASSSSHSMMDSPPTSPSRMPGTPQLSDSGGGTTTKKKSGDKEKKKKVRLDKDGLELVKDEDLEEMSELGAGNGGTVTKVWNKKRNCVMARKLILVDAKPAVRKQIVRELQILNDCNSPYIVGYYGCFPVDVHVGVVMECMDAGSLDYIYRRNGAIPIPIVGKVAEAVLRGLIYLYDVHRIIHRDIKPSNILANTAGQIKICDFGVSGELVNSVANTFVGTSTYMSPERIQGAAYTIKSDVWSLGISLIELATARFPFADPPDSSSEAEDSEDDEEFDPDPTLPLASQRPKLDANGNSNKDKKKKKKGVSLGGGGHTMSILDLLQHIVGEPAPQLVSRKKKFPSEAVSFVEGCLAKDPNERKSPQELLASEWIVGSTVTQDAIKAWAVSVAEPND